MRAVVQRVRCCEVRAELAEDGAAPEYRARIGNGLLVYLAVAGEDGTADLDYIENKIAGLRVFTDAEGRMERSVVDVGGEVLVVSQFTLYGDVRRGRRPYFGRAAEPGEAARQYEALIARLRQRGLRVASGRFRAHMLVDAVNDGPVTILLDSERVF
jgi:D-tyrosyl-tRNA(Tyr) deacylase